jgi:hypothetical protein
MVEVTKEYIYDGLKALQSDLSFVKTELHDITLRMIRVDEGVGGVYRRLDRMDIRFERLEHHLNFVDHPLA